ncbi:MAG: hypothetical protein ABI742_11250 [Gemmatimonadota bacterium]
MSLPRRVLFLAAAATVALTSAATAQKRAPGFAQGDRPELGAQIGYGTNHTKFFIGTQFAYPVMNRLDFYPSFQYYFPGNSVHFWTVDAAVRYWPKLNVKDSGLYAGGGLDIAHTSVTNFGSSTDVGLTLLSGWQFKTTSNLLPFGQIRVVIGTADHIDFGGGVNFRL